MQLTPCLPCIPLLYTSPIYFLLLYPSLSLYISLYIYLLLCIYLYLFLYRHPLPSIFIHLFYISNFLRMILPSAHSHVPYPLTVFLFPCRRLVGAGVRDPKRPHPGLLHRVPRDAEPRPVPVHHQDDGASGGGRRGADAHHPQPQKVHRVHGACQGLQL